MDRRWIAAIALASVLALLLALWLSGPSASEPRHADAKAQAAPKARPEEAPRAPVKREPRPRTARTGAQIFGINEGIALMGGFFASGRGSHNDGRLLGVRAGMVKGVGATLVRGGSHAWPPLDWFEMTKGGTSQDLDFRAMDQLVTAAAASSLDVVAVLGPWPSARTGAWTQSYVPEDLAAYKAWVQEVVERYDGDGDRDGPGRVLAWEVDNEPDLHFNAPGENGGKAPKDYQSPKDYATVLVATSEAIHAADPDALVLMAGLFRLQAPQGRDYLEAVMQEPGAKDAFDVLSAHVYFTQDDLAVIDLVLDAVDRLAPGKALWITETNVPSDQREPWATELWQARMLVAVHGALLAGGADRIFWHTMVEPPEKEGRLGFGSGGLNKGEDKGTMREIVPKPAAASYEALARAMAEVDPASLKEIEVEGGRVLESDRGWLVFWGAVEAPAGAKSAIRLTDENPLPLDEPIPYPAWLER